VSHHEAAFSMLDSRYRVRYSPGASKEPDLRTDI